jgi:hypothetical protein
VQASAKSAEGSDTHFGGNATLPFGLLGDEDGVREERPVHRLDRPESRQKILSWEFPGEKPIISITN